MAIQADSFFVENTKDVAFDFEKLLWVPFYLLEHRRAQIRREFRVHRLTPAPIGIVSVLGEGDSRRLLSTAKRVTQNRLDFCSQDGNSSPARRQAEKEYGQATELRGRNSSAASRYLFGGPLREPGNSVSAQVTASSRSQCWLTRVRNLLPRQSNGRRSDSHRRRDVAEHRLLQL